MSDYRSRVAGQVHNFSPEQYLTATQASRVDRYAQFALVAAKEALADADINMAKNARTAWESSSERAWAGWSWVSVRLHNSLKPNAPSCPSQFYSDHYPQFRLGDCCDGAWSQRPQSHHLNGLFVQCSCPRPGAPVHSYRSGRCRHCRGRRCQHYPAGVCRVLLTARSIQ